jgi:hypothetical protein
VSEQGRGAALGVSAVLPLLAVLLSADVLLIAVHIAKPYFDTLRPHHFSLEADRGLAEYCQYIKQAIVVLAMLWCWHRTRVRTFVIWSVFFALMLYDDSHSLHERMGEELAATWVLPGFAGLRPQDVGELLFAAAVGAFTISSLLLVNAHERGAAKAHTLNVVLLLAALAVCGVLVDAIHVIAHFSGSRFSWVLAVIEDGGELIVMTLITTYACRLAAHGLRAQVPLPLDAGRLLLASTG